MIAKNISAMEARKRFGEIMNRVALGGESFTIARAGKPLVRIVPITPINEDVFDRPFKAFTEWNNKANDSYDAL
jgi:prevent-host-death family protein